ncbi:MAG: hypothetical protein PHR82_07395 [Endomicrobiaceae bacterium]|nr:hypothetical protein [Endomicrobiaceae bacterium]
MFSIKKAKNTIKQYANNYMQNHVFRKSISLLVTVCFIVNIANLPIYASEYTSIYENKKQQQEMATESAGQSVSYTDVKSYFNPNSAIDENRMRSMSEGVEGSLLENGETVGAIVDGEIMTTKLGDTSPKKDDKRTGLLERKIGQLAQEEGLGEYNDSAENGQKSFRKKELELAQYNQKIEAVSKKTGFKTKTVATVLNRLAGRATNLTSTSETESKSIADRVKSLFGKEAGDKSEGEEPSVITEQTKQEETKPEGYEEVVEQLSKQSGVSEEEISNQLDSLDKSLLEEAIGLLKQLFAQGGQIINCATDALANILNGASKGVFALQALLADISTGAFVANNKESIESGSNQLLTSMDAISSVLQSYGKEAVGYATDLEGFLTGLAEGESGIVWVNEDHYVTVTKLADGNYSLTDSNVIEGKALVLDAESIKLALSGNNAEGKDESGNIVSIFGYSAVMEDGRVMVLTDSKGVAEAKGAEAISAEKMKEIAGAKIVKVTTMEPREFVRYISRSRTYSYSYTDNLGVSHSKSYTIHWTEAQTYTKLVAITRNVEVPDDPETEKKKAGESDYEADNRRYQADQQKAKSIIANMTEEQKKASESQETRDKIKNEQDKNKAVISEDAYNAMSDEDKGTIVKTEISEIKDKDGKNLLDKKSLDNLNKALQDGAVTPDGAMQALGAGQALKEEFGNGTKITVGIDGKISAEIPVPDKKGESIILDLSEPETATPEALSNFMNGLQHAVDSANATGDKEVTVTYDPAKQKFQLNTPTNLGVIDTDTIQDVDAFGRDYKTAKAVEKAGLGSGSYDYDPSTGTGVINLSITTAGSQTTTVNAVSIQDATKFITDLQKLNATQARTGGSVKIAGDGNVSLTTQNGTVIKGDDVKMDNGGNPTITVPDVNNPDKSWNVKASDFNTYQQMKDKYDSSLKNQGWQLNYSEKSGCYYSQGNVKVGQSGLIINDRQQAGFSGDITGDQLADVATDMTDAVKSGDKEKLKSSAEKVKTKAFAQGVLVSCRDKKGNMVDAGNVYTVFNDGGTSVVYNVESHGLYDSGVQIGTMKYDPESDKYKVSDSTGQYSGFEDIVNAQYEKIKNNSYPKDEGKNRPTDSNGQPILISDGQNGLTNDRDGTVYSGFTPAGIVHWDPKDNTYDSILIFGNTSCDGKSTYLKALKTSYEINVNVDHLPSYIIKYTDVNGNQYLIDTVTQKAWSVNKDKNGNSVFKYQSSLKFNFKDGTWSSKNFSAEDLAEINKLGILPQSVTDITPESSGKKVYFDSSNGAVYEDGVILGYGQVKNGEYILQDKDDKPIKLSNGQNVQNLLNQNKDKIMVSDADFAHAMFLANKANSATIERGYGVMIDMSTITTSTLLFTKKGIVFVGVDASYVYEKGAMPIDGTFVGKIGSNGSVIDGYLDVKDSENANIYGVEAESDFGKDSKGNKTESKDIKLAQTIAKAQLNPDGSTYTLTDISRIGITNNKVKKLSNGDIVKKGSHLNGMDIEESSTADGALIQGSNVMAMILGSDGVWSTASNGAYIEVKKNLKIFSTDTNENINIALKLIYDFNGDCRVTNITDIAQFVNNSKSFKLLGIGEVIISNGKLLGYGKDAETTNQIIQSMLTNSNEQEEYIQNILLPKLQEELKAVDTDDASIKLFTDYLNNVVNNGGSILNCSFYSLLSVLGDEGKGITAFVKALAIDIASGTFSQNNNLTDKNAKNINISMYAVQLALSIMDNNYEGYKNVTADDIKKLLSGEDGKVILRVSSNNDGIFDHFITLSLDTSGNVIIQDSNKISAQKNLNELDDYLTQTYGSGTVKKWEVLTNADASNIEGFQGEKVSAEELKTMTGSTDATSRDFAQGVADAVKAYRAGDENALLEYFKAWDSDFNKLSGKGWGGSWFFNAGAKRLSPEYYYVIIENLGIDGLNDLLDFVERQAGAETREAVRKKFADTITSANFATTLVSIYQNAKATDTKTIADVQKEELSKFFEIFDPSGVKIAGNRKDVNNRLNDNNDYPAIAKGLDVKGIEMVLELITANDNKALFASKIESQYRNVSDIPKDLQEVIVVTKLNSIADKEQQADAVQTIIDKYGFDLFADIMRTIATTDKDLFMKIINSDDLSATSPSSLEQWQSRIERFKLYNETEPMHYLMRGKEIQIAYLIAYGWQPEINASFDDVRSVIDVCDYSGIFVRNAFHVNEELCGYLAKYLFERSGDTTLKEGEKNEIIAKISYFNGSIAWIIESGLYKNAQRVLANDINRAQSFQDRKELIEAYSQGSVESFRTYIDPIDGTQKNFVFEVKMLGNYIGPIDQKIIKSDIAGAKSYEERIEIIKFYQDNGIKINVKDLTSYIRSDIDNAPDQDKQQVIAEYASALNYKTIDNIAGKDFELGLMLSPNIPLYYLSETDPSGNKLSKLNADTIKYLTESQTIEILNFVKNSTEIKEDKIVKIITNLESKIEVTEVNKEIKTWMTIIELRKEEPSRYSSFIRVLNTMEMVQGGTKEILSILQTENNMLALQIYLSDEFNDVFEERETADYLKTDKQKYQAAIAISRYLEETFRDNISFNIDTNGFNEIISISTNLYFDIKDKSKDIILIDNNTLIFEFVSHNVDQISDFDNLLLNNLNISKEQITTFLINKDDHSTVQKFLNTISNLEPGQKAYFRIFGHGAPDYIQADGDYNISYTDIAKSLIKAHENGVNLNDITINLSSCNSYFLARNIYRILEEANIHDKPFLYSAAGLETPDANGPRALINETLSWIPRIAKGLMTGNFYIVTNELAGLSKYFNKTGKKEKLTAEDIINAQTFSPFVNPTLFVTNPEITEIYNEANTKIKEIYLTENPGESISDTNTHLQIDIPWHPTADVDFGEFPEYENPVYEMSIVSEEQNEVLHETSALWEEIVFRAIPATLSIIDPILGNVLFTISQKAFIVAHGISKSMENSEIGLHQAVEESFTNLSEQTETISENYKISLNPIVPLSIRIANLIIGTKDAIEEHRSINDSIYSH